MRGRECATPFINEAGEWNARVRVVNPQRLVAENLLAQLLAARVTRDCVSSQWMQVQHKGIGNECVKEEFDAGASIECALLSELRGRTNRVFVDGQLFRMLEGMQKGWNVERDQVFLAQGCERDAAGLDQECVTGLCG